MFYYIIIIIINCFIYNFYEHLKSAADFNHINCQDLIICLIYRAVSSEFSLIIFLISVLKKLTLTCLSVYFYSTKLI